MPLLAKVRIYKTTFIDAEGDWLDTVHFPQSALKYPLQGRGYYEMTGKVIEEFGVYALDVHYMKKIGMKSDRLRYSIHLQQEIIFLIVPAIP